jgi:hypothetical protein
VAEGKIIIEFSEEDRELLRQLIRSRPTVLPNVRPVPVPYIGDPPYPTYPQWWQNPIMGDTAIAQGSTDAIVINSTRNVNAVLRSNG